MTPLRTTSQNSVSLSLKGVEHSPSFPPGKELISLLFEIGLYPKTEVQKRQPTLGSHFQSRPFYNVSFFEKVQTQD